jgi:plastocyanin
MRRAATLVGVALVAAWGSAASGHGGKPRRCEYDGAARAGGHVHRCRFRDEHVVSPPLPPRRLGVDENEYSVRPTHNPVRSGSVEFDVTNFGMDLHDFSIRSTHGHVLSSTPLASRASAVVTVKLRPGKYVLFCSLYDHEARGMRAKLTVR